MGTLVGCVVRRCVWTFIRLQLNAIIDNDPPLLSNSRSTVSYAAVRHCTAINAITHVIITRITKLCLQEYDTTLKPPVAVNRTTQLFVNLNDSNWRLDKNLFVPFGVVVGDGGMKTFDRVFSGYGQDPDQVRVPVGLPAVAG
jgi:hypothetical protein